MEKVTFGSVDELAAYMEGGEWTFDLEHVSGPMVPSTFNAYGYTVEAREGKVKCHLPFFGRAYRADYGSKNPMAFTAPIEQYEVSRGRNQGVDVLIETINEQQNRIRFSCNVFANGIMYINMMSTDTESINYRGRLTKRVSGK